MVQRLPAAVIGSAASYEAPLVMWDISLREVTNWMAVAEIGWPFSRMHHEDFRVAAPTAAARDARRATLWQSHNMRLTGCIRPLRASDPDLNVLIGAGKLRPRNAERTMAWQWQACD